MGLKRFIFLPALITFPALLASFVFLAFFAFFASVDAGYAQEPTIASDFADALKARDEDRMYSIVEENRDSIPGEIKTILEDAHKAEGEAKESLLFMVEVMANVYKDISGDIEFFKRTKEKMFDARLTPSVKSVPKDGVHIVEMPVSTETVENTFSPDNIVIGKGETVRWVNNDTIAHLLGSMQFIGKGGLSSFSIEPGKSWEYTFTEPGKYFYICFIHRQMIGKVTVE
jgi:plastocyanin